MFEFFNILIDFILEVVSSLGYLGIFIGMTIESSLFPFPSEILLIPAGALISKGVMKFLPVFLVAVLGSMLGAYFNYFLALFLGRRTLEKFAQKRGRSFLISSSKLEGAEKYFEKHGEITTFLARLIPGVRQIISLPAGFAKMNLFRFSVFTFLGASIWSAILIYLGYFFSENAYAIRNSAVIILLLICTIGAIVYSIIYRARKTNSALH